MATYPGVDPTGKTDSTAGIQAAINVIETGDTNEPRTKTLYFPNGTYLISGTLDAKSTSGTYIYRLKFVGQSESGTILTLGNAVKNANYDFTNAASPIAMIRTESYLNENNTAFDNAVTNMTINTGTNNPGAIGIDFFGSNVACVRNVTITAAAGSGSTGLLLTRDLPGPETIENVTINGFPVGVNVGQAEYSVTFENLVLNNQTTTGLINSSDISIHGLISNNSNPVPVITNAPSSLVVLVGDATSPAKATYTGGGTTTAAAIVNNTTETVHNSGGLFVRNFTSANYALAVSNPSQSGDANTTGNAPNGLVQEYTTHPVLTPGVAGDVTTSLNLPVQATPHFVDNNFADWYSVANFTLPDHPYNGSLFDQAPLIQQAIDAAAAAGKTTLYFPPGIYNVATPIYLHGSIRRVLGFGSFMEPFYPAAGGAFDLTHAGVVGNLQPVISIGGGPLGDMTGSVEINELSIYVNPSGTTHPCFVDFIQHTSQTVTLIDLETAGGLVNSGTTIAEVAYEGMPGVGSLFIDDVDGSGWYFNNPGQSIWARQFNPEGDTLGTGSAYAAKVTNTGSTLWILGLKTEDTGTLVESTAGAATEVLGGFLYSVGHTNEINNNVFDVQNSDFSGCYLSFGGSGPTDYPNQVGQTEGTQTGMLYEYSSANSPRAYLRKEVANYSLVPLVVASPSLSIPGIDIGSVGVAGTGSLTAGVYTITGSGTDFYGTADGGHFCYTPTTGDTTIIARVTGLQNTNANAKAAVMFRQDITNAGTIDVLCNLTPQVDSDFITRSSLNASASLIAYKSGRYYPYWLKLVRSGNSFSAYDSPDGTTWTQLGTTQTVNMNTNAYVGLGVTSHANTTSSTATFDNLSITNP